MTDNGGGWTLVMKINGQNSTFQYSSTYWTNATTYQPTPVDMSQAEAKYASYSTVPFTSILGVMEAIGNTGADKTLVIPVADTTSLQDLITNTAPNTKFTSLGRTAWIDSVIPDATPQANCNLEGINVQINYGPTCTGAFSSGDAIRIGLLTNQENDCCSPDSSTGFGAAAGTANCSGEAAVSAGTIGGNCYTGGPNVVNFGFLFVR